MFRSILLIAVAVLAVPTARAEIMYSDAWPSPNPPQFCNGWWAVGLWDLDGDDIVDYCQPLGLAGCGLGCTFRLVGADGNGVTDAELWDGAVIGPDMEWSESVDWSHGYDGRTPNLSCFSGPGCGLPGTPVFLGLRFSNSGGTHYAWVRIVYYVGSFITFLDYAYETRPDTPIIAGATGYPKGDLNGDGDVDGFDLALLLGQWTGARTYAPCPPHVEADLNGDCSINGFDLALLLGEWGP